MKRIPGCKITIKEIFEHRCSCGKLLQDHIVKTSSQTLLLSTLKMYYDLNTCKISDEYDVFSIPNGPGAYSDHYLIKKIV